MFEAVLDTGDEGYGFWMDGAVRDDPVFAEHWASRRAIVVKIDADQIVIRPAEDVTRPVSRGSRTPRANAGEGGVGHDRQVVRPHGVGRALGDPPRSTRRCQRTRGPGRRA